LLQSLDLVKMNAPEEDKIRAMMEQSTKDFDQSTYVCSRLCTVYACAQIMCPHSHTCMEPF